MTKPDAASRLAFLFELRISFVLRHSPFVMRAAVVLIFLLFHRGKYGKMRP